MPAALAVIQWAAAYAAEAASSVVGALGGSIELGEVVGSVAFTATEIALTVGISAQLDVAAPPETPSP